jgi:hypothetical protein
MPDKLEVFESRVRERAFALWQEAGCPEDSADIFWHRACEVEKREYDLSEQDLDNVAKEKSEDPEDFA